MRYLVTSTGYMPFLTNWFDAENNFNEALDMVVFDLELRKYMTDGKTWHDIIIDHL